jgi:hypothetical protein
VLLAGQVDRCGAFVHRISFARTARSGPTGEVPRGMLLGGPSVGRRPVAASRASHRPGRRWSRAGRLRGRRRERSPGRGQPRSEATNRAARPDCMRADSQFSKNRRNQSKVGL